MRDALRGESLVLCLALMNSRTPDVPAIAAASGYDAVYVDLEHTSTSLETAAMLCASATGAGIWALVRVSSQESSLIARVLDMGATGIIVPHVNSASEAQRVVAAARFPPVGHRSISGPNALSGFAARTATELTEVLEARTVVAVMVETPDAVRDAGNTMTRAAMIDALDAETARRIDLYNPMRVQRAWEVQQATGRGLAAWQDDTPPPILPMERCQEGNAELQALLLRAMSQAQVPRHRRTPSTRTRLTASRGY